MSPVCPPRPREKKKPQQHSPVKKKKVYKHHKEPLTNTARYIMEKVEYPTQSRPHYKIVLFKWKLII